MHREPAPLRRRSLGATATGLVLIALAGATGPASAAAPTPPPGRPPAWVVTGTRITHYSMVATVGAGSYELVEDPNGPLVDPATGKHYRESFTAGVPTEGVTGSGDGFAETTVVGVDDGGVTLSRTYYANDPLSATVYVGASSGERVTAADRVDGLWIHPDTLATLRTDNTTGFLVLHGPVTAGGREYQTVSIVRPTPGAYAFFAYDTTTGVLVASALRTATQPGGPLDMSYSELRGVRQLALPGLGAAAPAWVGRRPQLQYTGTYEMANPLDPATPPVTASFSSRASFTDVGTTWAQYSTEATVTLAGTPTTSSNTGATGGAGPYWWDPAALATMTAGQVLDTDPVTGQTVTVTAVGVGPLGPAVTIASALPGLASEAVYDVATGVMLSSLVTTQSWGTTLRASLTQMP